MKRTFFVLIGLIALGAIFYAAAKTMPLDESDPEVTLTFVGDIMLDRTIRSYAHEIGYENIAIGFEERFEDADILVGNLEGPITSNRSISAAAPIGSRDNMRFTFSPESTAFLTANSFDLVSIGNNHITDHGREGVVQTKQHLADTGVAFVGDPYAQPSATIVEQNGKTVAFIAFNQFNGQRADETVSAITRARETSDYAIVLAHWGEEYQPKPAEYQQDRARTFIDAGATVVAGTHPHVVQPMERYNGGVIFYSLGNFVFDQYWHQAVRCGLVASVTLQGETVKNITTSTASLKRDRTTANEQCDSSIPADWPVLTPAGTPATPDTKPEPPGETATVSRVIDGDTIELASGEHVRYIGVDTPETVHPARPAECYGAEASSANRELVEGKKVRLVTDISERDKYGRLLRYVYVPASSAGEDEIFVNKWLVENGYAHSSSYPPDVKHQDEFRQVERQAREKGAGLWSGCEDPTNTESTDADRECAIKGNISYEDEEKIYHVPGCDYYEQTVINESNNERWFCSEEEAREAGWRKARNCP